MSQHHTSNFSSDTCHLMISSKIAIAVSLCAALDLMMIILLMKRFISQTHKLIVYFHLDFHKVLFFSCLSVATTRACTSTREGDLQPVGDALVVIVIVVIAVVVDDGRDALVVFFLIDDSGRLVGVGILLVGSLSSIASSSCSRRGTRPSSPPLHSLSTMAGMLSSSSSS